MTLQSFELYLFKGGHKMSKQNISYTRTHMQNTILDLEKKYFSIIENIITSNTFINDLLLIEKEIRDMFSDSRVYSTTIPRSNKIIERILLHERLDIINL